MRLSPNVDLDTDKLLDSVVGAAIDPDEIISHGAKVPSSKTSIREAFLNRNAGPEEAAQEINRIMKFGDNDAIRLKAAETVLKVHGIHQELEKELGDSQPKIEINIISAGNVNLVNLLMPRD